MTESGLHLPVKRKKLRVAMVVIDGNDVSGEHLKACGYPSPSVHPAIAGVIDGLAEQSELECRVYFGAARPPQQLKPDRGSVSFHAVPYRRISGLGMGGAMLGRFLALRWAIRKWRPDIVHGQGTEREAGLVAAFSGFPSVLTLHGNFREIEKVFQSPPFSYHWLAARLETLVLLKVDHVICISRYVKALVDGFSCGKTVIPDPVGEKFLNIERPPLAEIPRVICMGSIDQRKQTLKILGACEVLWNQGEQFTFHVYGTRGFGSEYSETFFRRMKPWEDKGLAYFKGFTTQPELEILKATVMVSASVEESFGMNVLEAMAAGTVVVAPGIGGIVDIVESGKTGLLVDSSDSEKLACAIKRLLQNPMEWRAMSKSGRQRAKGHFTSDVVGRETVKAYIATRTRVL